MENYLRVKQVTEGPYICVVGLSGGGGGNIVLEFKPSSESNIKTLTKDSFSRQSYISYLTDSPFINANTTYYNWPSPRYDTETIKHIFVQAVIEVDGKQLTVKDDVLEFNWISDWGYPQYKMKIRDEMPYDTARLLSFTLKADPAYNAVVFTKSSTTDSTTLDYRDYGTAYNPLKLYAQGGSVFAVPKDGITLEDIEIATILQGGSDHQVNTDAMKALEDGYLELTQDSDGALKLGLKRESGKIIWSVCALLLRVKQK